jgi:hypothetical protein
MPTVSLFVSISFSEVKEQTFCFLKCPHIVFFIFPTMLVLNGYPVGQVSWEKKVIFLWRLRLSCHATPSCQVCPNNGPLAYSLGGLLFWEHPNPQTWNVQKKDKFAERLDTFMCNPNFNTLDYCAYGKFMRSKKLVLNYFEHIATCFHNISLRFHWTTCTCLYNFLHVCFKFSLIGVSAC